MTTARRLYVEQRGLNEEIGNGEGECHDGMYCF
ncbi:hypothetical protein B0G77_7442 [Paraburkholderia sp. BL10I2N1]|nr:hypothetical protein B0G77_7442 [Paraburkholderia sp. BL10I2N1]